MKKIITYCIIFLLPAFLSACADDKTGPMENNTTQPGEVSNVLVENMAGKVAISYTLPKDQDLLYVKGVGYSDLAGHVPFGSHTRGQSLILHRPDGT